MLKIGGVVKFRYFCIVILFFIFLITSFTFPEKIEPFKGKSYVVPYVRRKINLDGRIGKDEWKGALKIYRFYQDMPGYNTPPTAKTVIYLMYDSKNLYFAVYASLKGVDNFVKQRLKRDETGNDDVGMSFDTFCKYKKSYLIQLSPYGDISDGIQIAGKGSDYSPDFEIYSKGKIYSDHYEVEAIIPFKNFKFKRKFPMKWGVVFFREMSLKKGPEQDLSIKTDRNASNVFEYEDYLIFEHPVKSRSFYFIPEIVGSYNREDLNGSYFPDYSNSNVKGSVGGTFFLRPDSETRLGVTLNPDFSEVEADEIKFDVNHRFPIFYSEKRPFFLESLDVFSNPFLTLVHTRNIIDPDIGLKFIREMGNSTIASLYALERDEPGDRFGFPGETGDINWFVLRYKYSLKGDSYLGFYSLNRRFKDGNNNVLSFDGRYRIDKRQTVGFMGLYSRYTNSPSFNRNTIDGGGWDLKYDFTSRYFNYSFETYGVSDGFYDDVGFIVRNDYWIYSGNVNFHYEPESDKALLRSFSITLSNLVGYDFEGDLTDKDKTVSIFTSLRGGHNFFFWGTKTYELYLKRGYDYNQYGFGYSCDHFKKLKFDGNCSFGDGVYYDYYFPQPGSEKNYYLGLHYYPFSSISISASGFYSKMDSNLSGRKLYGFYGFQLETKYQPYKDKYVRVLYEYRHYNYPLYNYSENNHFLQIVGTYNPQAYTAFYVGFVYGKDHNLYHPMDYDITENYKFFVKIDYMFDVDF